MIKLTTARSLRVRYLIGLSAIALLVTTSFLTMQHVVSKQRNFAQIVNLAGQQRGLVNRLAYFASQMATTDHQADFDQARAQVGRTINRIEDNHRLLREGSPDAGVPKVTSPTPTWRRQVPRPMRAGLNSNSASNVPMGRNASLISSWLPAMIPRGR